LNALALDIRAPAHPRAGIAPKSFVAFYAGETTARLSHADGAAAVGRENGTAANASAEVSRKILVLIESSLWACRKFEKRFLSFGS
jgi:hypothetical protein